MSARQHIGWIGAACMAALAGLPALAATGPAQPGQDEAAAAIRDWPQSSQAAARQMLEKYGPPAEATATRLTWVGNGSWMQTVVHKSPVAHDFPAKHMDVLEQSVEYRVPLNFYEAIATFDGSVVPHRTRGVLSVDGDREDANILALNLADDIVQGRKSVEQARDAMAAGVRALDAGQTPEDARKLRITRPQGDLSDPDTAVTGSPGAARIR